VNSLTVSDAAGRTRTLFFAEGTERGTSLYDLPPLPPQGAFDLRFDTPEGGSLFRTHPAQPAVTLRWPILLQSAVSPLQVSWEIVNGRTYELSGMPLPPGSGSMKIATGGTRGLILGVSGGEVLPKEFALLQNYPNPFNPATSIRFALPVNSRVVAELFNLLGQRVRTLISAELAAGNHTVEWDGTGENARQLGSGVYFLRLEAHGENGAAFTGLQKLMMIK
jgi:hypothetical protein